MFCTIKDELLHQFHLIHLLFLITIMALENTSLFVNNMEDGIHWFVVCDTFRVVTSYNAPKLIWCYYLLLLYHFIVINDVQHHVRCYNRQTGDLIISEEFITNFDDSLCAYHLR